MTYGSNCPCFAIVVWWILLLAKSDTDVGDGDYLYSIYGDCQYDYHNNYV